MQHNPNNQQHHPILEAKTDFREVLDEKGVRPAQDFPSTPVKQRVQRPTNGQTQAEGYQKVGSRQGRRFYERRVDVRGVCEVSGTEFCTGHFYA